MRRQTSSNALEISAISPHSTAKRVNADNGARSFQRSRARRVHHWDRSVCLAVGCGRRSAPRSFDSSCLLSCRAKYNSQSTERGCCSDACRVTGHIVNIQTIPVDTSSTEGSSLSPTRVVKDPPDAPKHATPRRKGPASYGVAAYRLSNLRYAVNNHHVSMILTLCIYYVIKDDQHMFALEIAHAFARIIRTLAKLYCFKLSGPVYKRDQFLVPYSTCNIPVWSSGSRSALELPPSFMVGCGSY